MLNKIPPRSWIVWLVIIGLVFAVISILTDRSRESAEIKFSEFREAVQQKHIESVEIKGLEVTGTFEEKWAKKKYEGKPEFKTVGPVGEDMQDILQANEITYTFDDLRQVARAPAQ